jgi:putative effector of murein hydrolase
LPVVAQTSFTELPSTHLAGLVVRGTLITLHKMAFLSGAIFLLSSLLYNRVAQGTTRPISLSHILVVAMLTLTAISQFQIIPKMDTLRAAAGEISTLAANSPLRQQWDSLHAWSTRLEGTVLILGLIVLYNTARRFNPQQR